MSVIFDFKGQVLIVTFDLKQFIGSFPVLCWTITTTNWPE
jgi:hypothetical protein